MVQEPIAFPWTKEKLSAKELVSDELWELIQPMLPPPKPRCTRYPGRKTLEDRNALTGIMFVLKSGIPWEMVPQEMGCGYGITCWRRLRDWHEAGVWQRPHELLLAKLREADEIDRSRAIVDSAVDRQPKWDTFGPETNGDFVRLYRVTVIMRKQFADSRVC